MAVAMVRFVVSCYSMAKKNPAAVALGRKGGMAKVKKGIAMLTKAERSELAKKAVAARWGKKVD
jgi:hypothetical protein